MNQIIIPPWERTVKTPLCQIIGEDGTAILGHSTTYLSSTTPAESGDPYSIVLPDGNYRRQIKEFFIPGANLPGTAQFVVTGTFAGFSSLLFDSIGTSAVLEWDGSAWHLIGGNATTQA